MKIGDTLKNISDKGMEKFGLDNQIPERAWEELQEMMYIAAKFGRKAISSPCYPTKDLEKYLCSLLDKENIQYSVSGKYGSFIHIYWS